MAWLDTENKRSVMVTLVGALVFSALAVISQPLGHDETVYALGGYQLAHDELVPYPAYRPVAMQVVAAPAAVSTSDIDVRLFPVLITGLFLMLLLRLGGKRIGVITAIVVGTSWVVCMRGATLSSDVPAAALLLGAMLMIGTAAKPGKRWVLLSAAPLCAAAVYVRYGSATSIVVIALSAAIIWRRQWRELLAPAFVTGALGALLLVPLFVFSMRATGSPVGIFKTAAHAAHRAYVGDGLVYYVTTWWWHDIGPVATVFVVLGIVSAVRDPYRLLRFSVLSALGMLVATGISAHGESRYALLPLGLLVHSGAVLAQSVLTEREHEPLVYAPVVGASVRAMFRRTLLVACIVSFAIGIVVPVFAPSNQWPSIAAERIAALVRDADVSACRVLSETHVQIAWYSGCPSVRSGNYQSSDEPTIAAIRPEDDGDLITEQTAGWRTLAITPGYVIVGNDAFVSRLQQPHR
ncbi:MAG TPA: hypothetical protein VGM90_40890 [Kofleriaceae bacterium]